MGNLCSAVERVARLTEIADDLGDWLTITTRCNAVRNWLSEIRQGRPPQGYRASRRLLIASITRLPVLHERESRT